MRDAVEGAKGSGDRSESWAGTALVLLVVAIELASLVMLSSVAPAGSIGPSTHGLAASIAESSVATNQLAGAAASLAAGGGPAAGVSLTCSSNPSDQLSATCSTTERASAGPGTAAPLVTSPTWAKAPTPVPPPRRDASMVYDSRDKYVLLFGGSSPAAPYYFSDTWSFAGGSWTEIDSTLHPAGREGTMMTFDAADNYVLLFGGRNSTTTFSDTWSFAGGQWTPLHPSPGPGSVAWGSLVYDANLSCAVLFGGSGPSGTARSATWEYAADKWTVLTPTNHPAARSQADAAYDAHDGWVVLFGGTTNGVTALGDTWIFTGGTWSKLTPKVSPPAAADGAAAYDPTDQVVLLFGGLNYTTDAYLSATWEFAAGTWTKLGPAITPNARYWAAMAGGPSNGSVTLFGGSSVTNGGTGNDTWTYRSDVWTHQLVLHPFARGWASMTYDEADQYVVLFGGSGLFEVYGDTWKYSGNAWTLLHPSNAPSPRFGASMTYDAADGYVLLYGGLWYNSRIGEDLPLNDTWTFVHGQWSEISATSGGPPAEAWVGLAYDAADGYVLMFGGFNNTVGGTNDETWEYLNGAWTIAFPTVSPPAMAQPMMAYDSGDGYVVAFGYNAADGAMETWTWLAGSWTNVTSSQTSTPSPRSLGGFVYDSYDGYLLLYGGQNLTGGAYPTSTWSFGGGRWTELDPSKNPGVHAGPAMAYDPLLDKAVLFGGFTSTTVTGTNTWVY